MNIPKRKIHGPDGNSDFDENFEFDWRSANDLGQLGSSLMVKVEDETNKDLIWLK